MFYIQSDNVVSDCYLVMDRMCWDGGWYITAQVIYIMFLNIHQHCGKQLYWLHSQVGVNLYCVSVMSWGFFTDFSFLTVQHYLAVIIL
jgi:hypothetical protein